MRLFKYQFRPKDFIVFPLAIAFIFVCQYFVIQSVAKDHDDEQAKKLDLLAEQCRNGAQDSCDKYRKLLEKVVQAHEM